MSMQVQTEDITVPWGQAPDHLDHQYGKWRLAVFQDVQESLDASKLYFLYDPIADDTCVTTGGRKGMTSFVVFDTLKKCFVAEIPLRIQVNMNADGLSLQQEPYSLMNAPLMIDSDFICSMREDKPELVIVSGPGMNVVRIDAASSNPKEPIDRFSVPGAELSHFYDGFVSIGNIYFLSASPDGLLDWSRVHVLSLENRGQISTYPCTPDPQRGMPPGRKQAALDSIAGFILMAGGEIDYGHGNVTRLVDYWVLDITTFKWHQVPASMPVGLIEPRLTTTISGNVYLWGDYDEPLPGMPPSGTHVRIMRIRGFNTLAPPSYNQATGPNSYPNAPGQNNPSYGYPGQGSPPYGQPTPYPSGPGSSDFGQGPYPAGQYSGQGYPGQQGPPPTYPVYPPKKDDKCCLS